MKLHHGVLASVCLLAFAAGCARFGWMERETPIERPALAAWAKGAQLFEGLGTHHREVDASSRNAQAYFDQGLRLLYGFNHDEAARSFAKGGEFDPECAMCWWGAALVLGPNYNMPMMPDRFQAAWDAMELARKHSAGSPPVERALIEALGKRFKGPEPLDPSSMQPLSEAYAAAMRDVAKRFPDDLDVQT
ncbi:MAG: hypothetical protein AB1405_09315, partial [Bdellovibrionota bacterium]